MDKYLALLVVPVAIMAAMYFNTGSHAEQSVLLGVKSVLCETTFDEPWYYSKDSDLTTPGEDSTAQSIVCVKDPQQPLVDQPFKKIKMSEVTARYNALQAASSSKNKQINNNK